jgi:DNA-binding beta-propeller fold protein YncE
VYLGSISVRHEFEPPPPFLTRVWNTLTGTRDGTRLVRPAGICVRGSLLAVADPGAGRIHLLDLDRRRWVEVWETATGALNSPVDVACLPDGGVVTADSGLGEVLSFDSTGRPRGRFVSQPMLRPTGLSFDASLGRLWVVETLAHRVRVFDAQGGELLRVGSRGTAPGHFNFPTRVAADAAGGAWITDSLNYRVQHIDAQGRPDAQLGEAGDRTGALARPRGLLVDPEGRILLVDALLDAVQIFDAAGRLLFAFGGRGAAEGQFWLPSGIALDEQGHLFVADSYNGRVQVFSYRPPGGP